MKKIITCLLALISAGLYAQGEARNWYFGVNAGIKFFEDGSVGPVFDSQMSTNEGCSSISDANGNLLFYTDGRNVWDRNHIKMPNGNYDTGTGLLGDPSSTQSGIIVPRKGDPNIYYIFTVDEPHHTNATTYPDAYTGSYLENNGAELFIPEADDGLNNGLNYSIVDLSVTGANGSIGDVVERNNHLLTYDPEDTEQAKYKCSEKITAVRNADGTGFWVITHFINKFYAFEVTAEGVNETPVVTTINPNVPTSGYRRNSIGCIKASPDGTKLAIAHMQRGTITGGEETNGGVFLYDFDAATGILSNAITISQNTSPYGVEFSPKTQKLYVSYDSTGAATGVHQYNLLSANIPASDVLVGNTNFSGTLQLGPDGRIYRAAVSEQFLDVIHDPEEDGFACNYETAGIFLFNTCTFGLPPFITSYLSGSVVVDNTCLGQTTGFQLNIDTDFDSVSWDFGDGSDPSTAINPSHTYAATGEYNVVTTITRDSNSTSINTLVRISAVPVANAAPNLTACDPDSNGSTTFDLRGNNAAILGSQSVAEFEVLYFASQADADANTNPLNAAAHINTTNPQTIFARIQNRQNSSCFDTTSFQIHAANTPLLNSNTFGTCDTNEDGDDANGFAEFNLNQVTGQLVQNSGQFTTTYYASEANAQAQQDPLPVLFTNTVANTQDIHARIVNNAFPECSAILPVTLVVNPLPPVVSNAVLVQCDPGTNPDGLTRFNLTQANSQFTGGSPALSVAYFLTEANADNNTGQLSGAFNNTSNPQEIVAKVINTATGCYRLLPLTLQANTNTAPFIELARCDDDGTEDGLALFDLTDAGLEGGIDTTVQYYASQNDALMEQNAITADFTNTVPDQHIVYARIETNNECTLLREIRLIVHPLPDIDTEDTAIVCQNTNAFITINAGVSGSNYTYLWSTGANTSSIMVNEPGVYTVTVTNTFGCFKERTVTVSPSNIAVINDIIIEDLRENNTVTVLVSPRGNVNTKYQYSLNRPLGPYQDSNVFENVPAGVHTVYVYDTNGCGVVTQEIAVLEIPKFFTPNGDGVNDTWRIVGLNSTAYANSTVHIFDRYGKLVAEPDPGGPGWDGTFNGYRLPATDYWYVVKLDDGREVKGHFSMIR